MPRCRIERDMFFTVRVWLFTEERRARVVAGHGSEADATAHRRTLEVLRVGSCVVAEVAFGLLVVHFEALHDVSPCRD